MYKNFKEDEIEMNNLQKEQMRKVKYQAFLVKEDDSESIMRYGEAEVISNCEIVNYVLKDAYMNKFILKWIKINGVKTDFVAKGKRKYDSSKLKIYCKNPKCFNHYLANKKIKEVCE